MNLTGTHIPGVVPFKRAALDAYKGVWLATLRVGHQHRHCVTRSVPAAIRINYRRDRSDDPFIVHRLAAAWWALVVGLLILIILLILIAQNTESITVHFLVFDWSLPVRVGYLLSAVAGATTTAM